MKKSPLIGESLLRTVAENYEITLGELYAKMPQSSGETKDFYPLALLHHAGYIEFSLRHTNHEGVQKDGYVGETAYFGAGLLAEWCLMDEHKDMRTRLKAYLTAKGLLKLEELAIREEARKTKRTDYFVTAAVAVGAACLTGAVRLVLG